MSVDGTGLKPLLVGWTEIEEYVGYPAVNQEWLEWGFPLREIDGVPVLAPELIVEWVWVVDRAQRELGLRHDLYDDREPEIETAPPALHQ